MSALLENILLWSAFLFFIFMAAYFAISETAIIALDRVKLRYLAQSGNRRARSGEWLKSNPKRFFGIILLGSNVAVVASAAIGSHYLFFKSNEFLSGLLVNIIILVFAEVTPKKLALQRPTRFALSVSPVIRRLAGLFGWVVTILTYLPSKLFKLDVGEALSGGDLITELQIKRMVDFGEEEGAIDEGESELIGKVIDTGNKTVEEIMIPRIDVVSLREGDRLRDAVRHNMEYGLSRFPVFSANEDDVLGFIHTKDLIGIYLDGDIDDYVENHLRPIVFVPESKPAIDLLFELKATKSHISIVIDEYGQVVGMVTLEDLLEEVVGDIYDESDQVTRLITKVSHEKYMLNGSLEIEKAEKLLGIKITGEYETIAGFVMGLLGRIPVKDDKVHFSGLQFKVGQMDKRRIRTVFVKKLDEDRSTIEGKNV